MSTADVVFCFAALVVAGLLWWVVFHRFDDY